MIPEPFISVIGTIQPAVLDLFAGGHRNVNGFIDRILFVMPDHVKKEYWNEAEMPEHIVGEYRRLMNKLLDLQSDLSGEKRKANTLRLDKVAKNHLFTWQKYNTDLCNTSDDESLSGIYSKLDIYTPRFTLMMQLLRFACDVAGKDAIDQASVEGAIKLTEYFRKMANKVNFVLNNPDPLDKLNADKRKLYKALPDIFGRELGLQIADNLGFKRATFDRFVKDKNYFIRVSHGTYEKLV